MAITTNLKGHDVKCRCILQDMTIVNLVQDGRVVVSDQCGRVVSVLPITNAYWMRDVLNCEVLLVLTTTGDLCIVMREGDGYSSKTVRTDLFPIGIVPHRSGCYFVLESGELLNVSFECQETLMVRMYRFTPLFGLAGCGVEGVECRDSLSPCRAKSAKNE